MLTLGVAYPLGPELAHFHDRQAALAGEAINEKRFADPDTTRHEDAALDDVGFAILDEPGQLAQFCLAAVWVATQSRLMPGLGSLKRTRPRQYSSMSCFLLAVTSSEVTRVLLRMASARKCRMRSKFRPAQRAATSGAAKSLHSEKALPSAIASAQPD